MFRNETKPCGWNLVSRENTALCRLECSDEFDWVNFAACLFLQLEYFSTIAFNGRWVGF